MNMNRVNMNDNGNKMLLDDAMLENIIGGNAGDSYIDHDATPMYSVNQQVEVFYVCEWFTKTHTITGVKKNGNKNHWVWIYEIDHEGWISADDIERDE